MPDILPPDPLLVTTGALNASQKLYIQGARYPDLRVAMREITLADGSGEAPVRVYDTSGPYTDPAHRTDIRCGLPALRASWIAARGDMVAYE